MSFKINKSKRRVADVETWGITVNDADYSKNFEAIEFSEAVSNPIEFTINLVGISPSNDDFSEGNDIIADYDGHKVAGIIVEASTDSNLGVKAECIGYSVLLGTEDSGPRISDQWTGVSSTTIVSDIVGSYIDVGTNTELAESDDFRADDEVRLNALTDLMGDLGGEWWVDLDEDDNPRINVDSQRGGGDATATYNTDRGDVKYTDKTTKQLEKYDGVIVKGYGDGDDQVRATAGDVDGDNVPVYTNKRIVSESQAQKRADEIYANHSGDGLTDNSWTEITLELSDPKDILEIGDVIEVVSEDAGVDGEFRVTEREYKASFKDEIQYAEIVCSNKNQKGVYRKGLNVEVKENKSQTNSQTDYMQGSRNVWAEKEADNASNTEPLIIDFHLPSDVVDQVGENRTNSVRLDYSCSGFKQSASSVKQTKDTTVNTSSTSALDGINSADKDPVYELDIDDEDKDTTIGTLDAGAVTIEDEDVNDEDHEIYSSTTFGEDPEIFEGFNITFNENVLDDYSTELYSDDTSLSNESLFHVVAVYLVSSEVDDSLGSSIDDKRVRIVVTATGSSSIYSSSPVMHEVVDSAGGNGYDYTNGGINYTSHFSERVVLPVDSEDSGSTEYELYIGGSGTTKTQVSGYFVGYTLDHNHSVPTLSNGLDLFDSGSSVRLPLKKYDNTSSNGENYKSSNVDNPDTKESLNDVSSKTDSVGDNSGDSVDIDEISSQESEDVVTEVDNELVAGNVAEDVAIIVDGENIDGSGNTRGTNQESEIDITDYLTSEDGKPEVGWHTVTIRPEPEGTVSYVKGRVFVEHHKESN